MIRSNLAVLLAERNLKITRVSMDTGISRTTLTALCNNYSQGIQFDTLNELCFYLDVSADELITFLPVDIKITDMVMSEYTGPGHRELSIFTNIRDRRQNHQRCCLEGYLVEQVENHKISQISVTVDSDEKLIRQSFQKLPRAFFPELERALEEKLLKFYPDTQLAENFSTTYIWSDDLMRRGGR